MSATSPAFSERTLEELLAALRARTTKHPDNPGLIAFWPAIREDQMPAACAELRRRGHPVFRVAIDAGTRARPGRNSWALAAPTDQPMS